MRRTGIALTLGVAIAGLAVPAGVSAKASGVITPPAGTPNLALMVIQPSDLVPGAVIGDQAYVKPPRGFTAQYGSDFTSGSTSDGVSYSFIADFVALAPDASTASSFFAGDKALVDSRKGRKLVVKGIIKDAGKKAHLKARGVKFSGESSAGVGTSSFMETITIHDKHVHVQEIYLIFEDGTVCASLELVGATNKQVPPNDAISLAGTINSHIATVLGTSTGSTGPS